MRKQERAATYRKLGPFPHDGSVFELIAPRVLPSVTHTRMLYSHICTGGSGDAAAQTHPPITVPAQMR
jgi:hypothetical protein